MGRSIRSRKPEAGRAERGSSADPQASLAAEAERPARPGKPPGQRLSGGGGKAKPKVEAAEGLTVQALTPAAAKPKPDAKKQIKLSEAELAKAADSATTTIMTALDAVAAAALGDEARMTGLERKVIADPLGRMMRRMEPAVIEAVSTWTDPLCIGIGLLGYGTRLYQMARAKREAELAALQAEEARAETGPQASSNGKGGQPARRVPFEGSLADLTGGLPGG